MARPKKVQPTYGTTVIKGITYYRTRITDSDGKRVPLYAKTPEELTAKVEDAKRQISDATFRAENPTVREYCEKWLSMHAGHIRETTLVDYTSKVKIYIMVNGIRSPSNTASPARKSTVKGGSSMIPADRKPLRRGCAATRALKTFKS